MVVRVNGSTGISGVDGSAGTPALQGSDSNTGISFGTDTVSINTGGTARATVDSNGRLGVGTTSPSYLLDVNGVARISSYLITSQVDVATNTGIYSQSANTLQFQTNNLERARIDSSGRLGIGTSAPQYLLDTRASVSTVGSTSSVANILNTYNNFDVNPTTAYTTLRLTRDGKSAASYPSSVDFAISRYENVSSNSRTQLDIKLAHGGTEFPETTVMSLRSDGNLRFNSGYGSVATAYGVRAWVNFDGQGPGSIRGNGNVSSFTKNANGDFTVNFTTAMPDGNYCALVSGNQDTTTSDKPLNVPYNTAPSTSAVRIINSGGVDYQYYMVAIIR